MTHALIHFKLPGNKQMENWVLMIRSSTTGTKFKKLCKQGITCRLKLYNENE